MERKYAVNIHNSITPQTTQKKSARKRSKSEMKEFVLIGVDETTNQLIFANKLNEEEVVTMDRERFRVKREFAQTKSLKQDSFYNLL